MSNDNSVKPKCRLVLGDQLSRNISALDGLNPELDIVVMAEVRTEATYVKHHKKKIAFLFSAMRHFAAQLKEEGVQVEYIKYNDSENAGSLLTEVKRVLKDRNIEQVVATFPGEWRVLEDLQSWQESLNATVDIRQDTRFSASIEDFEQWASGRKQLRMEYFYRELRKRYQILMTDDGPEGGEWNYDSENRKKLPKGLTVPEQKRFAPDEITSEVLELVAEEFQDHFGSLEDFHFATTREEALAVLDCFVAERLENFGDYQDAMKQGEPWLFHSHISFYLNCGLLDPTEVLDAAESAYTRGDAPLNAVEGFIRQVLGWREYVRGLYWTQMPSYATKNFLEAERNLPEFFWTANTKMNCLSQCISETEKNAYAHHIQRLMVLGNFLLLTGVKPEQVNEWYLIVYADAYEWVEMPNVNGMILFADGGVMASKPYSASGAYINKMSDYCKSCDYKVTVKNGESACPFNYLYWDFLDRNRSKLEGNPRLGMPYRTLSKMTDEKRELISEDSRIFLKQLDDNAWV